MSDEITRRRAAAAANNRRAAEAAARGKAADAAAEAARASAESARSTLAIRQLEAAAEKRKFDSEHSWSGKAWQAGVNIVMPAAGVGLGMKMAKTIEKRHVAATAVRNAQIAGIGKSIATTMSSAGKSASSIATRNAKLAGAIVTSDKLRLAVSKGPAGLGMGAVLLAEGAMARFVVAPAIKNETASEVIRGVGTASAFAASTLVAKRMVANATPRALPNAAHVARIETARRLVGADALKTAAAAAPKMGIAVRALSIASKAALPLMVAHAAYSGYQGFKRAGAGGAALGVADSLSFGLATPLARMAGYTAQSRVAGRVAVARQAAARTQAAVARHRTGGAHLRSIARLPRGDGMTKAYTRVQAGKAVRVSGYKTPRGGR